MLTSLVKKAFHSPELLESIAASGTLSGIEGLPDWVKRVFVTARDISPTWHVRMQAAFQEYTDNAVSKTVNFPFEAGVESAREVYLLARELGCKGVTIYRDGSRSGQPMSTVQYGKGKPRWSARRREAHEDGPPPVEICPECGNNTLILSEGCRKCVCGHSGC